MQLKRIFPDSLNLEIDPEPQVQSRFWEISGICARFYNQLLEQRRSGQPIQSLDQLRASSPELARPADSVLARVIWSLEEAFEQYNQARSHFAAGRRSDIPAPPGPHPESDFFPLYFSPESVRIVAHNCLELFDGGDWFRLELPKGDYAKVHAVLIRRHSERGHFEIELNPIMED